VSALLPALLALHCIAADCGGRWVERCRRRLLCCFAALLLCCFAALLLRRPSSTQPITPTQSRKPQGSGGGKKKKKSAKPGSAAFWSSAPGWKAVEVGEDFLLGAEDGGFAGLEILENPPIFEGQPGEWWVWLLWFWDQRISLSCAAGQVKRALNPSHKNLHNRSAIRGGCR